MYYNIVQIEKNIIYRCTIKMSTDELSHRECRLFNEICARLYTVTQVTPDWHLQNGEWVQQIYCIDEQVMSQVMDKLSTQYPGEHFWTDYLRAQHSHEHGDSATFQDYLRSSAECGNPYAAYSYTHSLFGSESEVQHDVVMRYLKMAADIGHHEAIMRWINQYTNFDVNEYLSRLNNNAARHEFIAQLLVYAQYLRTDLTDESVTILEQIYSAVHYYDYPCPRNAIPYSNRADIVCIMNDDPSEDPSTYKQQSVRICRAYEALHDTYTALQRTNDALMSLNSMSLDDVCKSIIRKYC